MTVRELIQDLERMVAAADGDDSAEVVLYDRTTDRELRVQPDDDRFDFEVLRGDDGPVIEFSS